VPPENHGGTGKIVGAICATRNLRKCVGIGISNDLCKDVFEKYCDASEVPLFILHIALQGCLRSENVEYGLTADTGGHIRYLLDLASASSDDPAIDRIVIATRLFESPLGTDYATPFESGSGKIEIVRLRSYSPGYIEKEAMHGEAASFAAALIGYIQSQDIKPDIIHAHYADAAAVAVIVEDRLGIPFLFTAHSLGRVKQMALRGMAAIPGITERLASEEVAMARAAIVIASSRDEAEVQWSSYTSYEAGRIRILPPGIDLSRFDGATRCAEVEASIDRFLRDPEKPVLLALARPVHKKNLAALVTAYGENKALQDMANLVIFAGTREVYQDLDGNMAETVGDLLDLIDRYDLYGKVAYPKTHRAEDVPAIYAYARDRRGIFVNPALNEPFGLTLLEASAVGLPLIATDSGGPNDIIEMAGNGRGPDPFERNAVGRICRCRREGRGELRLAPPRRDLSWPHPWPWPTRQAPRGSC
jgi:sucrose-phosphate synthase